MGKIIRNGIEYGGGNGTDIYEVTQAQYNTIKQAGTLVHNALYVITDAENLNCTASDIEYSTGVDVKQAIDGKQFKCKSVWSGSSSTVGDTLQISGYASNKLYLIKNLAFSGDGWTQNTMICGSDSKIQYAV